MHRFYAFHSFTHFHRNGIAQASVFLAAKVEEQPRKLEHVIKAANKCLNQTSSTNENQYNDLAADLVFNENVLLQTLGFDVAIDHPHTHVVKTCHLVKGCVYAIFVIKTFISFFFSLQRFGSNFILPCVK